MRRIALTAALCLWAVGALAGEIGGEGLSIGTSPGYPIMVGPPAINLGDVTINGRDLQKQLDAIQTQLKCVWIGREHAYDAMWQKCGDAFKDIEPK